MNGVEDVLQRLCDLVGHMGLGASVVADEQQRVAGEEAGQQQILFQGSFEAYYSFQDKKPQGASAAGKRVSAIHFYDRYIVIEREGYGGEAIPLRQVKTFHWK